MDRQRYRGGQHLSASGDTRRVTALQWLAQPSIVRGAVVFHYLSLLGAFVVLLYLTRTQWFFFDEWEFLGNRGFAGHSLNLFFPHNEHWSTVPILIYRALFAIVGLQSYLPYMTVLVLLHIAAAHLLWRLMNRAGADAWVATALAVVFLALGAGYENLIWAFQIGFVGSVLCGLAGLYLVDRDGSFSRGTMPCWALLIVGLMCSGIGVTMVAVVALAALFRRGVRAAIIISSVPALVYVLWLLAIGRQGFGGIAVNKSGFLLLADFAWRGLTATVDGLSGLIGVGAVAVVGIFVWLSMRWRDAGTAALAFAGAIGAAVFFLITGVGRVSLGIDAAAGSRYVYVASALLLPSIAIAVSTLARHGRVVQIATVTLLAFSTLHGVGALANQEHAFGLLKQQSKNDILAAAQLISTGVPLVGDHPDPVYAPDLTLQELAEMKAEGKLPPAGDLTDTDHLDALLALEVAIGDTPALQQDASVTVVAGIGGFLAAGSNGCVSAMTYGANHYVTLVFNTPGHIMIQAPAGQVDGTTLAAPSFSGSSNTRHLALSNTGMTFLSNQLAPSSITLSLPATPFDVCGQLVAAQSLD